PMTITPRPHLYLATSPTTPLSTRRPPPSATPFPYPTLFRSRVADLAGRGARRGGVGDRLEGPGDHEHAQLARDPARRDLVAHRADRGRRWTDEDEPGGAARLGERSVLGEEPVAGMDRVGAGRLRDVYEPLDVEVA